MELRLENIGKRFKKEWVFKGINKIFGPGIYPVLGGNGSGKSTLLKIVSGASTPSTGNVVFQRDGAMLKQFDLIPEMAFSAPYLELPEELTLREFFAFSQKIKPYQEGLSFEAFVNTLLFEGQEDKPVKYFSSGMKQRLRLGHVLLSKAHLLILDEPSSNLDAKGLAWYQSLLLSHAENRIVLVGSNFMEEEYPQAKETLLIKDYK